MEIFDALIEGLIEAKPVYDLGQNDEFALAMVQIFGIALSTLLVLGVAAV